MIFGVSKYRTGWPLVAALVLPLYPVREAAADRPRVVATTTIVADLVRQVAGERVDIDALMGPGVDPHSYKATPRDAERLSRADLVVASGLRLEGKITAMLERLGRRTRVVQVAEALPRERLIAVADDVYDPHVWFDPTLWAACVPAVVEPLASVDAEGRGTFVARADEFRRRLEQLDGEIRERISAIPESRRVLLTSHDAFHYFGRAFAMEVFAVQGVSTESEAGLHDVVRLVDLVVDRRLPAVFVETSVADRTMTALKQGAAARGHDVRVGGRLYSDALGEPGSNAETLEAALRANVAAIVAGLGGDR